MSLNVRYSVYNRQHNLVIMLLLIKWLRAVANTHFHLCNVQHVTIYFQIISYLIMNTGKVSVASCESMIFFQNVMHDGLRLASNTFRLCFGVFKSCALTSCHMKTLSSGQDHNRPLGSSRPLEHLSQIQELCHVADEWLSTQTASVGVETGPEY